MFGSLVEDILFVVSDPQLVGALDLGFKGVDYGDIVEELWNDTAPHPRRSRSTRTRHRESSSLRHRSQPRPRQSVGERQTSRQRRVHTSPRGEASRSSRRRDGSGWTSGVLSSSSSTGSGELPRDPSQHERRRFRLWPLFKHLFVLM